MGYMLRTRGGQEHGRAFESVVKLWRSEPPPLALYGEGGFRCCCRRRARAGPSQDFEMVNGTDYSFFLGLENFPLCRGSMRKSEIFHPQKISRTLSIFGVFSKFYFFGFSIFLIFSKNFQKFSKKDEILDFKNFHSSTQQCRQWGKNYTLKA